MFKVIFSDHFDYVKNLIGVDYIGIGGDYDGVGSYVTFDYFIYLFCLNLLSVLCVCTLETCADRLLF